MRASAKTTGISSWRATAIPTALLVVLDADARHVELVQRHEDPRARLAEAADDDVVFRAGAGSAQRAVDPRADERSVTNASTDASSTAETAISPTS